MSDKSSSKGHGSEPEREHLNALQAYTTLGEFLEQDCWYPQRVEDKHAYRMYFHGKNGEMRCYAQIRVDLEVMIFYVIVPVRIPEEVRCSVAEFIARANYGLRLGNLELDYGDGEVRFKNSLDFEGETLTPNMIKRLLYPAVQTLDQYMPGLLRVAFGARTPVEAIQEVETR